MESIAKVRSWAKNECYNKMFSLLQTRLHGKIEATQKKQRTRVPSGA